MFLSMDEAFKVMREGKTVRHWNINKIEICQVKNTLLFKHSDGHVELLDWRTIDKNDVFVVVSEHNKHIESTWTNIKQTNTQILR